uniref:RELT like 2 n=1 Tax=Electrophorus electricus TaxID=8005 RepID=A0A4W4FDJ6_ELEEL
MTDQETSTVGEVPPPYIIFLLVFFFFITGLLGFIICHILKKKGYRCRTGEPEDEDTKETFRADSDDGSENNQDTVEQILKCIIENEVNVSRVMSNKSKLNDGVLFFKKNRIQCKESLGGIPPHLHTVHSGSDQNSCHHCMKSHFKKTHHRNGVVRSKGRPVEQTVFSVGRFRVTHMEKNSFQESTNPSMPESEDPSDHMHTPKKTQESYNIRNMFKDIEAAHGTGPVTAKQNNITLLGFNRCSDLVGMKEREVAFENNNQPHIPGQLPAPSQKTFGPGDVLGTDPEVTSVKISLNISSQNTLEEAEAQKINILPDTKQAEEMASDKSEAVEVQLVKANLQELCRMNGGTLQHKPLQMRNSMDIEESL